MKEMMFSARGSAAESWTLLLRARLYEFGLAWPCRVDRLSLFASPSDLSDLAVQTCSAVVGYKEGVQGQHYGRHEPFGSPNSVFTLRGSYGRTSGRCLIRVLTCFFGVFSL